MVLPLRRYRSTLGQNVTSVTRRLPSALLTLRFIALGPKSTREKERERERLQMQFYATTTRDPYVKQGRRLPSKIESAIIPNVFKRIDRILSIAKFVFGTIFCTMRIWNTTGLFNSRNRKNIRNVIFISAKMKFFTFVLFTIFACDFTPPGVTKRHQFSFFYLLFVVFPEISTSFDNWQ
mgnify:CR=1 FL=1